MAILYIPEDKKSPEVFSLAVKSCGMSFQLVPEAMRTSEMCMDAIMKYNFMVKFIPQHLLTDEMITAVISNSYVVGKFINKTRMELYYAANKIKIHHDTPKQMPDKAYDTLEMGYDEETAIQDGELMVDFHKEFEYGRYYRKATFEKFVLHSKLNPTTRERIKEYTIYQAKV